MELVRHTFAAVLIGLPVNFSHAQDPGIVTIKVTDKRNAPVESSLYLNPGMQPIGKTSAAGEFRFNHKCKLGQTFKAQPADRGRFYDSEEQVCGELVELAVFPRPWFTSSEVELFHVGEWQGLPVAKPMYAGVIAGLADKVEPIPGGQNGRCRLTLDRRYTVGLYNSSTDSWRKVETLTPSPIVDSDSVFVFPSPCEEAQPKIAEAKQRARLELLNSTKSISASQDIGADVQRAIQRAKW
jgi:hypothetical protein